MATYLAKPDNVVIRETKTDVVKFGVIGYGYWGPNVVRNLGQLDGSKVVAVSDKSPAALKRAAKAYPNVTVSEDSADISASPDVEAVL
jgi:predicted dehydrogenase